MYVQNRPAEQRKEVIRLLDNDAFVYSCGSARVALVEALMECKSMISEDTDDYVRIWKAAKRFREYFWTNQ